MNRILNVMDAPEGFPYCIPQDSTVGAGPSTFWTLPGGMLPPAFVCGIPTLTLKPEVWNCPDTSTVPGEIPTIRVYCWPDPDTVRLPMVKLQDPGPPPIAISTVSLVAAAHVGGLAEGGQLGSIAGPDVDPGAVGDPEPLPPPPPPHAIDTPTNTEASALANVGITFS